MLDALLPFSDIVFAIITLRVGVTDAMLHKKKPTWGIIKYHAHPSAEDEEKLKPRPPDSCSGALYPWVQAEAALPRGSFRHTNHALHSPSPTFHQHPLAQGRTRLL